MKERKYFPFSRKYCLYVSWSQLRSFLKKHIEISVYSLLTIESLLNNDKIYIKNDLTEYFLRYKLWFKQISVQTT